MQKKRILVFGLNPSWQKTLSFAAFTPYAVNRAESMQASASGKGVNFLRAAAQWTDNIEVTLIHFTGGDTGAQLIRQLESVHASQIVVDTGVPTRTCTTILSRADHSMTELIEPAGKIPESALRELSEHAEDVIPAVDAVAICGTYPPGVPERFYADLIRMAHEAGKPVLLDAFLNVNSALREGMEILKINKDELLTLADAGSNPSVPDAVRHCMKTYPIRAIAVTDGADSAWLFDGSTMFQFTIPPLAQIRNPIGSGDTCSAVTLCEILSGAPLHDAFHAGLAAASANCLTDFPADYRKQEALLLMKNITQKVIS